MNGRPKVSAGPLASELRTEAMSVFELLVPGDILRLKPISAKKMGKGRCIFYRKLEAKRDMLLVISRGKPLKVKIDDVDWEDYRRWKEIKEMNVAYRRA